MIRVTTAMIARYMPELMNGSEDSGSVPSACTQLAAQKCLKDNDLNKDQILTKDEVSISQTAFDQYDANQDGKLDIDELKNLAASSQDALASYIASGKTAMAKTDLLATLVGESASSNDGVFAKLAAKKYVQDNDADKDGKLSAAETGFEAEDFAKLDTNEDGAIDQDEMTAFLKPHESELRAYFGGQGSTSGLLSSIVKKV